MQGDEEDAEPEGGGEAWERERREKGQAEESEREGVRTRAEGGYDFGEGDGFRLQPADEGPEQRGGLGGALDWGARRGMGAV